MSKKREEEMSEEGAWGIPTLRDHMERRATKGMVGGRRKVRGLWYLKH